MIFHFPPFCSHRYISCMNPLNHLFDLALFIVFDKLWVCILSAILGQTWLLLQDLIISKFSTHNLTNNFVCLVDHFSMVFVFLSPFGL